MGSTSEKRCFKLSSCNSNTATQNLHAYGILLIAALSTLLLIIYNFSDQVLAIREGRVAESREAAARSARKTANTRQRWQSAKDAAKKHAIELQAQLSRTFSRNNKKELPSRSGKHHQISETDVEFLPANSITSCMVVPNEMRRERSSLRQMIENDPDDDDENFNGESEETSIKREKIPKEKQFNTQTQIFKYAYTQLEKVKAQQQENKNLTFSGVIRMAINSREQQRKGPLIEISFKDLTLTLKSQRKHILRCVTGKVKPGRITAVIGPSGAG